MSNELRKRVVLTSLGFAFYVIPAPGFATETTELTIADRLARLHAAQDAGVVQVDIVGKLLEKASSAGASDIKTAQWLQTFEQQFSDGSPG
jgi:hypothetical protein